MSITPDAWRRVGAVLEAETDGFVQLAQIAELDPAQDFCGADLRGADLSNQDLTGFRFCWADVRGARLEGVRGIEMSAFLGVEFDGSTAWPQAWRAAIRDGALKVDDRIRRGDPDTGLWVAERVYEWADGWGRDRFGPYVDFSVTPRRGEAVTQRMRWCPPGRFRMGSPKGEEGRWEYEGPPREVRFARGFWMFDTACTAELWVAVKGPLPKMSIGRRHPVKNVSLNDAQDFVARLNAARPGLQLALPSEAEWEYACRAGTATRFHFGDEVTQARVNFDGKGAVEVGSFPASAWGLFEMHGNVWEWCADAWHASYEGAPDDGTAWLDEGSARRVVRGGSWGNDAPGARSAARLSVYASDRIGNLGFRCARVHAVSEAERRARGSKRQARSDRDAPLVLKETQVLKGHVGAVWSCQFSSDGEVVVSGGEDESVRLWRAQTGETLSVLRESNGGMRCCRISQDGRRLISGGDDGYLNVWDLTTDEWLFAMQHHRDRVMSCDISPDGKFVVSAGDDGYVAIKEFKRGGAVVKMRGHRDTVLSCTFAPDGRRIVSGGEDGTVRVWDVVSGKNIQIFEAHDGFVTCCAFSPDGRLVVSSGDDGSIKIWDLKEGGLRSATGSMSGGWAHSCGFSPDGRYVVMGSADGTIRLWNGIARSPLPVVYGHVGDVWSCSFSADGKRVVSAGQDETVRLWDAVR